MFSADDLHQALRALQPERASGYLVGLSGGADSAALLVAMAALRPKLGSHSLRAVHIHHGLQSAARGFAVLCETMCRRFDVPLSVIDVRIDAHSGRSIEELAREARYAALEHDLHPGEVLLTAHHSADQAETFLLQALRGAGTAGLAAMPAARRFGNGWHLRPLLGIEVAELRGFLGEHDVEYVVDAMNEDRRFDRAYLRQVLWPTLLQRWPAAAAVLSRSAAHAAQSQHWCDVLTQSDLDACRDGATLSTLRLRHLSHSRQLAVLRAFVDAAGCRAPSQRRLEEGLRQMLDARADRMPALLWADHALRRFQNRIFLTPSVIDEPAPRDWNWRAEPALVWGAGMGVLRWVPRVGGLDPIKLSAPIHVRVRAGGESIKPMRDGPTREVRLLFQQRGIVPWMRAAFPYVYAGESLLAVADLWTESRHRVAHREPGLAWSGTGPTA